MLRWFLSSHPADQALAERLKAALERKDAGAQVYSAPSNLRDGGLWLPALAGEIERADAFILLVGEHGVANWQVLEYYEALDKHIKRPEFPVIPVLIEGQTAPGLPYLQRLHWIVTSDPSSENAVDQLFDAAHGGIRKSLEQWRHASPYRGLLAMDERDSDYFFGREGETLEALLALASTPDQPLVLLGNLGVGKSSLAQAGVLGALKRQAWPPGVDSEDVWPRALQESRRWCFLTLRPGTEPLKALVESFLDTWQLGATYAERVKQENGWIELLRDGKAMLRDLLDATERRYNELERSKPPAFFLYVDQGEELYVRAEENQRRRFSEVIAQGVADPRLYIMMSMGAEFIGEFQKDEPLFKVHRKIDVPPLREAEVREIVTRPAKMLSAQYEETDFAEIMIRRTVEDSGGGIGLLAYILEHMWSQMVTRADGVLRARAQYFDPGSMLVYRADQFLVEHPKLEDEVRRIFVAKLVAIRDQERASRRRALRSEFSNDEWRLVSELASHPTRLLVTATSDDGEPYAEVVHEDIIRRWPRLLDWITADRNFIAWKTGLESARRAWQEAPDGLKDYALLTGLALQQAQEWLAVHAEDIAPAQRAFITESIEHKSWWRRTVLRPVPQAVMKRSARPIRKPRGSKVFISYRRDDTRHIAGRVYDWLAGKIPQNEIFFDVDTIPMGVDFKEKISEAVSSSAVVLVLIGDKWLNPNWKRSRLSFGSKPKEDFVQAEIESALDLGVPIVPLLVDEVSMPDVENLPSSMAEFVSLNAAAIRAGRDFHMDMARVLEQIEPFRKVGIGLKKDR